VLNALIPSLLIISMLLLAPEVSRILRGHDLPVPRGRWRALIFVPLLLLQLRYLHWRLTSTLPELSLSPEGLWPLLFLVFEMTTMLTLAMTYLTLTRRSDRTPEVEANLGLLGQAEARVAVFIPTYNEPWEVLERTLLGAISQRFPGVRVCVLDDSRRGWLRARCAEFGVEYCQRDNNLGAKAGNMNAGLATLRARGFDPEFIAVLDADFIAKPDFVSRCLVLHLLHPDAGLVQTPQHFFNPDPVQMNLVLTGTAPDEQRFFFDELLPSKDAWGTAFSCGTSALIRTRALDAIGGFPTESVTEDMLMSLRMREHGWQTLYLNEPLSTGLSPQGCSEYIKQRHRWCLGFIQIVRNIYNPFSTRHRLGLRDRVQLLDTFLYWAVSFPARYVFLLAPVVYWVTGWQVVVAAIEQILLHLLPWLLAHALVMAWISRGSLQPVLSDVTQLLTGRAAIHATLTGLFSKGEHKFVVTPKGDLGHAVRIDWQTMSPILILAGLNLCGILIALFPSAWHHDLPFEPRVVNLFWLIVNSLILALTALACIERPRRRVQERMQLDDPLAARVQAGPVTWRAQLFDLSLSGCHVDIDAAGHTLDRLVGNEVVLELGNNERYRLELVRRSDATHFGGRFVDLSMDQRMRLFERVFAENPAYLRHQTGSSEVLAKMLHNLWSRRGHR
jgi:cellulose synthase (UDP-forming)